MAAGVGDMFERIPIPTPFQVGPVNAYLAGRTLIDPGPDSEDAWATLLEALEARDLTPSDLDRVLVTHPHPDHFGLAGRLRSEGVSVCASGKAAELIADFEARVEREQSFFLAFFQRHGMAAEDARAVVELPAAFLEYAPGVETDRVLGDEDTIEVAGESVTALAVEGHAPGELVFEYDDGTYVAVVGDHVLPEISPNPLLQPPEAEGGDRPRVLPAYNRSLARLGDRGYDRILPGHRDPVEDPAGRVDAILAEHDERSENVLELVDGPTSAVEIMEGLFGDLPVTEYFSGMSEAIGHLDVLEERDRVTPSERGGLVVYRPVG